MAYYVISYDLHNARTYQPVWDLLESWGAVRLLESMWLVEMTGNAGSVREAISSAGDTDDSFAVIELKPGSDWSTIRAKPAGNDWLTRNIRRY